MVRAFDPGSRAIVPKVYEGSLSFYVGGTRLWGAFGVVASID